MPSNRPYKVFEKTYHGFEDLMGIARDVYEALDIPGEFLGDVIVRIIYIPPLDEDAALKELRNLVEGQAGITEPALQGAMLKIIDGLEEAK